MSRKVKKILLISGLAFILAIAVAFVVAIFNEDKISAIAINQLNSILKTEVKVEKIEFSLLRRFPKASIEFKSISIKENSAKPEKDELLIAQSLFLEFNPFDLLTGNYVVDQISVHSCVLNIAYFNDGSNNFQFFNTEESDENFKISLKNLELKDAEINYADPRSEIYFAAYSKKLHLAGDFESTSYDLNLSSAGDMKSFQFKNLKTTQSYPYSLDLLIDIKNERNTYAIKKADVVFDKIPLVLYGDFQKFEEYSQMNLAFETKKFQFKDAFFLIPSKAREKFTDYDAKGQVNISGSIKGRSDNRNIPSMNMTFSLDKGEMLHKDLNVFFKNIALNGSYSNGTKNNNSTSEFSLTDVEFESNYGKSKGKLSISNFDHPYLKMELSSSMDLEQLKENINEDSLEVLKGSCEYSIIAETFLDSLSSINVNALKTAKASGHIKVQNAQVKWKGYENSVNNIHAESRFGNNLIYIDSLHYDISGVNSDVNGKLHNFLPFLFYEKETLSAQINLHYSDLDLNKMLNSEKESEEKAGFFLPVSEAIKLNVSLRADKFELEKFKAEKVRCVIISQYPHFVVQNLEMKSMEGQYEGWLNFDISDANNLLCVSKLNLTHVNVSELFYEFNNFTQTSIKSENLAGYADARILFNAAFDQQMNIKQESIEASCHIEIKNGRLVNYAPIMALSKFIDVEELKDISFSKLSNDIEISKRMVMIPEMDIHSSALELSLSGKHSFDNEIDYHFKLWLNDFLFRKAKKSRKNDDFGEVEKDDEGRSKLYIRMEGTVDDYRIKLDRKALREKWKEDFDKERDVIKTLLKNEFSEEKKDKKEAPIEIGIEWEEFDDQKTEEQKKEEEKKPSLKKDDKKKNSLFEKLGGATEDEFEEYDPNKFD